MFDVTDPGFLDDPYPVFARARAGGDLQWHDGLGLYAALSHPACDVVLRSRPLGRIWRDREPAELFPAFNLLHRTSILESEPPTHTRLRGLVAGAFGRGHVERLRPWVQSVAAGLVADLRQRIADGEQPDLIEQIAAPLPIEVIAQLLGVPRSDRPLLQPWSNAIVKMYEPGLDARRQGLAERAAAEFAGYLRDLIARRRGDPRSDDLVSDLITASDGADRLTPDEIVGTCVLLLMAGHEASVNLTGNGTLALLRFPDQWRMLVRRPSLVPQAAEELIRFDSPLQLFERTAVRDFEIAGVRIRAGEKVAALLGAAGHDPLVFASPERLDITRSPNRHLGFGAGIHFCLGAPLARIEIQAVLGALISQVPELALGGEPVRRPEFVIRGLSRLPVTA